VTLGGIYGGLLYVWFSPPLPSFAKLDLNSEVSP
jgi:hypothetical protein